MAITKFAHTAVGAAKQKLIEIEYRYIEDVGQLFFQAAGIGGDAA